MEKILLAIGSENGERILKTDPKLQGNYTFTSVATHRDSIMAIATKEFPDIILIREALSGTADIMDIVFSLRTKLPKSRIIFMSSPRNPGDPVLKSLVSIGVYDIITMERYPISLVIDSILNPKTFSDVSHYLSSGDMQGVIDDEQPIFNKPVRKEPQVTQPVQKEVDTTQPKTFGSLKIETDSEEGTKDYNPFFAINKSNVGVSSKPNTVKPDISEITEFAFDEEEETFTSHVRVVKNVVPETKPEESTVVEQVKKETTKKPNVDSEFVKYTPSNRKAPFIREDKPETIKQNPSKPKVKEPVKKDEKPIEDGRVMQTVERNEPKNIKFAEEVTFNSSLNTKKEEEKPVMIKPEKSVEKQNKGAIKIDTSEKKPSTQRTEYVPPVKEPLVINKSGGRVYTFVHDVPFTYDHSALNVAIFLALNGAEVLYLAIDNYHANINDTFIDFEDRTLWLEAIPKLTAKKVPEFQLENELARNFRYTHVVVDLYPTANLSHEIGKSTKVVRLINQTSAALSAVECSPIMRRDIAAVFEYRPDVLSSKTILRDGLFKEVVRVNASEVENFNAATSKIPLLGKKNKTKALEDYEPLVRMLEEDKVNE